MGIRSTKRRICVRIRVRKNHMLHSDMQYCLDYYCDRKDHAVRTIQKYLLANHTDNTVKYHTSLHEDRDG